MSEHQSSYRQIFKATSIFGGVQVFNIIISVIKYKVIAIFLGPNGVGMFGLYNSTIDVFKSVAGLGINQSAVKEIAEVSSKGDKLEISKVIKTINRWVFLTGAAGSLIFLTVSPYLSQIAFDSDEYTWAFMWLSIVVFLSIVSAGQLAALQGLRKLSWMAKASMWGALIGLIISIPLFYYFSYTGVLISIIVSAILSLIFSSYFASKIEVEAIEQPLSESMRRGGSMVKLGIFMMFSSFITTFAAYILRAYISNKTGVDDVGVFQSGFAIIEGYFGLIFTAMATDYFPRLAAINNDNKEIEKEVNKQSELGLLIIIPLIVIALFLMPTMINLLYSSEFGRAVPYLNWAMLGIIFKVGSFANGYVLFAKGVSKVFIWTAIIFNIVFLFNNIVGYNLYGIEGIGMSFFINYAIHFIVMVIISKTLFNISMSNYFWKILLISALFAAMAFAAQMVDDKLHLIIAAVTIIGGVLLFSYREVNKLIDINQIIKKTLKQ